MATTSERWQAVVAYLIIPGIDGSDEQHWQSLWEREWGPAAVRIAPASWSVPDLDDWVEAVQVAHDEVSRHDRPVVLVAHSLGCWAAARWLDGNASGPVAGAFLVAPPDPRGEVFASRVRTSQPAATFIETSTRPLPCPALVVGSSDDPYCAPEATVDFAARWQARRHVADGLGHINSTSGLGAWPQGRALLDSLTGSDRPPHGTSSTSGCRR